MEIAVTIMVMCLYARDDGSDDDDQSCDYKLVAAVVAKMMLVVRL